MRASCQFPCRYRHRITTQAIFQKRKRPAFPRIIAEFASLMEVTTRFELVNEGFADLCLTTWPRHHMSRNCFLLFFWSGRRGSNSLPPPWQGGALPDELRPHGGEFGFVALSPGDECYYMAFDVKSQAFFAYFFKKSYVYCFSTVSGQFFSRSFRSTLYCLPQNWQLTSAMGSSSRSFSTSFLPRLRMVRSTRSRLQSQQ